MGAVCGKLEAEEKVAARKIGRERSLQGFENRMPVWRRRAKNARDGGLLSRCSMARDFSLTKIAEKAWFGTTGKEEWLEWLRWTVQR